MIEPVISLIFGILVVLTIIAVNGYFVAQEFAYMAVDRTRLAALAAGGNASAKRALAVTKRTSFMLSGAQLGITVTGLLVGYVAQPLVGESLGALLSVTGIPAESRVAVATGLTLVAASVLRLPICRTSLLTRATAGICPVSFHSCWIASSTFRSVTWNTRWCLVHRLTGSSQKQRCKNCVV